MSIHWLPLTTELEYNRCVASAASHYGCEAVHFSHTLCHHADDLLEDQERAYHALNVLELYRTAGLEVWCWTHEFTRPPAEVVDDGWLRVDAPELYDHLRRKYRRFLADVLPGITGIVLTFAECEYPVYQDRNVRSRHEPAERVRRLVTVMREICRDHGVKLAVRDFVYRKAEIDTMVDTIRALPGDVAVMSKCVPHDWHPYYPMNPVIGAFPERVQWVEHDLGFEYEGQHTVPYANLDTFLARMRAAHQHGGTVTALRLDRFSGQLGQSALHTPWGRLMLKAAYMFDDNPAVTAEAVWERAAGELPVGAREIIEKATGSVRKSFYIAKMWIANHSDLPTFEYADSHIIDGNADRLPVWTREATHREIERRFRAPSLTLFDECMEEADEGLEWAREAARRAAAAGLDAQEPWGTALERLQAWAELFRAFKQAYLLIRLREQGSDLVSRQLIDEAIEHLDLLRLSHQGALAEARVEGFQPGKWVKVGDTDDRAHRGTPWEAVMESLRLKRSEVLGL